MGFIIGGLDTEAYDRSFTDKHLFIRIITYFRPHLRAVIGMTVLIVINSFVDSIFPVLMAQSIDLVTQSHILPLLIWLIMALIFITGILAWGTNYLRQIYTAKVISNVIHNIRKEAFSSAITKDMFFYDSYTSGKIASRIISDTEKLSDVMTLPLNLCSQCILCLCITLLLFTKNIYLTLITLLIAPLIVGISLLFRKVARKSTLRLQRMLAHINASVQEAISGIIIAKNFRQEHVIYDELHAANQQLYKINVKAGFLYDGIFPILSTLANLGTALLIYFGGRAVLAHVLSAGEWFLFIQSVGIFWFPLTGIASFWDQFQQGLAAAERVFSLIDVPLQVYQTGAKKITPLLGGIIFEHVYFGYTDQQTVLHDFNLAILPGQTVALVGQTGAGKSTIAKLIARFYEFQRGRLTIDGNDIRTLDLSTYRRQIGVVSQRIFLFSGTVFENILYACPQATKADVYNVCCQIGDGDWLESLSSGLETQVGEGGKDLSMGQKQIIALCRAFLQNPSIVMLDEATANIDVIMESMIQEGIEILLKDRTALVIAHRLSTIMKADRIIVLQHGRILEEGNHLSLLQQNGYYAQLYSKYFRHQSPDYIPD